MSLAERNNGTHVVLTIYNIKFWVMIAPSLSNGSLGDYPSPFNGVYEMMQSRSWPSEMKMCVVTVRVQRKTAGKENILHIFHVLFI